MNKNSRTWFTNSRHDGDGTWRHTTNIINNKKFKWILQNSHKISIIQFNTHLTKPKLVFLKLCELLIFKAFYLLIFNVRRKRLFLKNLSNEIYTKSAMYNFRLSVPAFNCSCVFVKRIYFWEGSLLFKLIS